MRKLLCVLSLFVMLSCNKSGHNEMSAPAVNDESIEMKTVGLKPVPDKVNVPERKLIRNGSMSFEVDDVDVTRKKISELANEFGGYISSEKQNKIGNDPRHEQVVRVPGDQFDAFVNAIEAIAMRIDDKNFSAMDVTEEFVDLESRLVAKKELEVRFREIVKQAQTIEDILNVEYEIGTVRTEIEQIEGKVKYLSNKISFSTITLTFYENSPVVLPGTGARFAESFVAGWNSMVSFLIGLTRTWPFLLILAATTLIILRRKRKEPLTQTE